MTYRVELTETYRAYVDIEAASAAEAERLAEERLASGDLSLADTWSKCDRSARVVSSSQPRNTFYKKCATGLSGWRGL